MYDQSWEYKGHKCEITHDYEEDCIKAWHEITTPDGKRMIADISPYDSNPDTVNKWIDAGYPGRDLEKHYANWRNDTITEYLELKRRTQPIEVIMKCEPGREPADLLVKMQDHIGLPGWCPVSIGCGCGFRLYTFYRCHWFDNVFLEK